MRKEIDILLKDIIKNPPKRFIQMISGKSPVKLLDTELTFISNKRADFVVELEDGSIMHIEFQSYNDPAMADRMFDYNFLIYKKTSNPRIHQFCIYVGNEKVKMPDKIEFPNFTYHYNLIDIRDINCRDLIVSESIEDKLLAALCNIQDPQLYIKHMRETLEKLPRKEREDKIFLLIEIVKLRDRLKEGLVRFQEEREMPIRIVLDLDEIMNDPFLGEIAKMAIDKGMEKGFQQGIQQGIQQGLEKGIEKGKIEEAREAILEVLDSKFGVIPEDLKGRLDSIEDLGFLKEILRFSVRSSSLEEIKLRILGEAR